MMQGRGLPGVGGVCRGPDKAGFHHHCSMHPQAPAEVVALAGFHPWSPEKLLVSWDVVFTYLPVVSLLSENVKACVIL